MFQENIVVKWPNGDLEGFSGSVLSSRLAAREAAIKKARIKYCAIMEISHPEPITICKFTLLDKYEFKALPEDTKKLIRADWEMSSRGLGEYKD